MPYFILFFLFTSTPLQAQKLDASYEVGEDLLLVEFKAFEYEDYQYIRTYGYDLTKPFAHIYWNPKNNQYYYAKAGSLLTKTNGLTYKLDPAKTNATLVYHPRVQYAGFGKVSKKHILYTNKTKIQKLFARNLQPDLAYAGWISSNQRLFVHIPTQQQYLQTLSPIDDEVQVVPTLTILGKGIYVDYGIKELWEHHARADDGTFHFPEFIFLGN